MIGGDHNSVLISFFETLKAIAGKSYLFRSIHTGIAPMPMGGANVFVDLTHDPALANVVGFPESVLEKGLEKVFPGKSDTLQKQRDTELKRMRGKIFFLFLFYLISLRIA